MKLVVPGGKKFVHELVIPIRWGDMDAMGHVNNTLYLRYFEIVRLDWMFRVGAGTDANEGHGPLVVNVFCNFHRQLEYPADVRARLFVASPGRSSFDTFFTLERTDEPGKLYSDGGGTAVWTDYAGKKSAPLPDWFRALLV